MPTVLAKHDYDLILVALSEARLKALSARLTSETGRSVTPLPADLEVDEMVDAALVGLDRRELVTIPSLPDMADWEAYTAARLHLGPNLSRNHVADRYKTVDSTRPSRAR
jgi:short-subunit dehydrogenase